MADMMVPELKEFLKIDGADQDSVLGLYQSAAETYLLNAGCPKNYDNALYKVLVVIFCGKLVENPTLLNIAGGIESIGITFNGLVDQLRKSQS